MAITPIEWTHPPGFAGESWNPTKGCRHKSPGCLNCYAERMAARIVAMGGPAAEKYRLTVKYDENGKPRRRWSGQIFEDAEALSIPLRTRRPTCWFVDSMSDLFDEGVSDEFIAAVFGVMAACQQHRFLVLTKSAERMERWFQNEADRCWGDSKPSANWCLFLASRRLGGSLDGLALGAPIRWPLPNVWLGVSVENQEQANARIPRLLRTPAAVRFLSCEPLLEKVQIPDEYLTGEYAADDHGGAMSEAVGPRIDWVIVGGESGPGARPMHPDWARSLRDQCVGAGTAFFFKQWGTWTEIPYDHENPPGDRRGERYLNAAGGHGFHGEQVIRIRSTNKKIAGRELDGRTWDEYPKTEAA